MASDPIQATTQALPAGPLPRHWYRLRFRKVGSLRLVSHIDLLHVFERLLRRADLPIAFTQGFHPKPCLVFAQALALGVAGLNEVVDLELAKPLPEADVLDRLQRQAPPGLEFFDIMAMPKKGSAVVRRAFYRMALPAPDPDLPRRCAQLLARERCLAERAKPQPRRIDIRPYLHEIAAQNGELTMGLWITPYGAARPEEVVKALDLGTLLDEGAVLERTRLEMMDDLPESDRWLPDIPRLVDAVVDLDEFVVPAAMERPAPSGEALLPNPLSFET